MNRAHNSSPTSGLGNIISYENNTSSPPTHADKTTWPYVKRADSAPEAEFIQRPTSKRRTQSNADEKRKTFLEKNRLGNVFYYNDKLSFIDNVR